MSTPTENSASITNLTKSSPHMIALLTFSIVLILTHTQSLAWYSGRFQSGSFQYAVLASIVLFIATIWRFMKTEKSIRHYLIYLFPLLASLSLIGIRIYVKSPKRVAYYVSETYKHNEKLSVYRESDFRNDLFDPNIGEILLNNAQFRSKLLQSLDTHYADSQSSYELRKNHKLAWIVLAYFRHQGIAARDWLKEPSGKALGSNLLSIEFAKSSPLQLTSLMKIEAPYSVKRTRTWTDLPTWFTDNLTSQPDRFRYAGILNDSEIKEITQYLIRNRAQTTKLELEAALLSILSYPQHVSEGDFSNLMISLKTHKKIFSNNIKELEAFRKVIQARFKRPGEPNQSLGFNVVLEENLTLKDTMHGCSDKEISHLIISFGFIPIKGNDITFICTHKRNVLRSDGKYTITGKDQTKQVLEEKRVWSSGTPKSKLIKKEVLIHRTSRRDVAYEAVVRNDIDIGWRGANETKVNHGISTTYELDHQYWSPGDPFYSQKTPKRKAHWLYTLPRDLFY